MFLGQHQHSLDEKGRIVVPAALRDGLDDVALFIALGDYGELGLWPEPAFLERLEMKRARQHDGIDGHREYAKFTSFASKVVPDKQYRIAIPEVLRERAGLTRSLVIVGMGDRMALWDLDAWDRFQA